ncbi:MAG: hypothetical protein MUF84_06165 [Anaerolineae bacterium]|nr:hypothetical protein [Anaerolineae bacterium]
MRRSMLIPLVLGLSLVVGILPVAAQVPGPNGPYNSAFTIQNLEATPGTCMYELYDGTGTMAYASTSFAVSGSGSYFVYVGGLTVPSNAYSAVISCDVNVAAVSNYTGSGGASAASYGGIASAKTAQNVSLPGVYKNYYGYNSNVVVQNVTAAPVDVTLKVYSPGNSTPVAQEQKLAVPANAAVSFNQATMAGLANGLYSAKVEATGAVAAIVNIWSSVGQQYSYGGVVSGSGTAYAPVLMNGYYGFNTALTVQNLGLTSTDVTVTYSNGKTSTASVAAGSSKLFYTPNEGLPAGWLGSAKIVSSGEIVALVNESDSTNRAASYIGFATGSTSANAPIVLKTYYGYSTSITCQNIGAAPTNVTVTYSSGVTESRSGVAVNGTALFYQPNTAGLASGFNGSAVITAAQDIVCVVNENQVTNPTALDFLLTYEAVSQ